MADENKSGPVHGIEAFAPAILKTAAKRQVLWILRWIDRHAHIRKGPYVEFGRRFRFDRSSPHEVIIRERTIIEDNNVWNAQMGDIIVGRSCWFGLNNIVMGPLEVGDRIGTGPYVMILGPRHPVFDREFDRSRKTTIGSNVTIASGSIILFGVHVGDNAIIMAGSVVHKDVPEGAVVAGNPARNVSGMVRELWDRKAAESDPHASH